MRRATAITLVLLCSALLMGADGGPADMVLIGPDTAKVSESVRLRLDGLPAVDLTKTMQEQLAWLSRVKIITAAPRGVSESDYALDQQLSIKVGPFQWTFSLDFLARKPGDYEIICDWNEEPYGLIHHRVSVGGSVTPDPTDPSTPTDPQHPPMKINRVTYVYEKSDNNVPRPVAAALAKLNADSSVGIVATEFEDDTTDGDGEVPDQHQVAKDAATKAGLPCLVVQAGQTVVRVVKNPQTEAQVLEAVKP